MQKVVEFLQKNPVQYLATVGRDGKAKCRPFMFCFEQDGKHHLLSPVLFICCITF